MKSKHIILGIVFLTFFFMGHTFPKTDFPVLKGPYLGQKQPGMKAELFAPGLLAVNDCSPLGLTVTPDGLEA